MNEHESFQYQTRPSPVLITCDHATNRVPDWMNGGDLGIDAADMVRHIAYDVGALAVTKALADHMQASWIASDFSRLVIDPNRGLDDPTLIMKIYDRTIIPANRHLDDDMRKMRIDRLYRPYHQRMSEMLAECQNQPILIAIHSFTPQLRGGDIRPWQIGILSAADRRLAEPVIAGFSGLDGMVVGDNEPYTGALPGDTLDQHGIRSGIAHVLIEIRNDLIENETGQAKWANILYQVLNPVLKNEGLT